MIFYTDIPNLVVNSKRAKRIIARFDKNGKFETHNQVLIEKLKEHFRYEESPLETFIRLKKEAVKKGINTHRMKKADLIKALEECER
ncbi:hypothetical protein ES695_10610 [Candidatus Atribacteria bacterium 1244-E10-H5-B2]|nr:MAG: hypothetical protein ES695_10610 [Candidatus Atribacteria bacterium 1244-E10-H5-B2]